MASIPSNPIAAVVSGSASVTGSFAGFTAIQATTFTGLKDGNGSNLAAAGTLIVAAGTTVPLFVTSASISSGAILLYP